MNIISVSFIRVVIDPNQNWYRLEEAAEYLGCGPSKIYDLVAEGRLPKARNGDPIFSRKDLDKVAAEGLGKKKPLELKKAA